jgi:exonuclease III
MKVLTWNCRGAGKEVAYSCCKRLIASYKPDCIALLETQIQEHGARKVHLKVAREFDMRCISARGRSGGIIFWWKERDYQLTFIQSNRQGIFAIVRDGVSPPWVLGVVYASVDDNERRYLWESMTRAAQIGYPMVLMGDFNVILSAEEKSGSVFKEDDAVWEFRDCIQRCGLVDMKFVGSSFT